MTADDLKKMEIEGLFAQGYALMAWDADSERYEKVTGVLVSSDGLRVELQTDSDECDPEQCDCLDANPDAPNSESVEPKPASSE
jgi:hypothetical protein